VQEFCENFNLMHFYKNMQENKRQIEWVTRRSIMLGIARSLNYMHLNEIPLIHRDLKSLNIFLDRNQSKLGDFGSLRHSMA
jgi:serine/threonine protein kinase